VARELVDLTDEVEVVVVEYAKLVNHRTRSVRTTEGVPAGHLRKKHVARPLTASTSRRREVQLQLGYRRTVCRCRDQ